MSAQVFGKDHIRLLDLALDPSTDSKVIMSSFLSLMDTMKAVGDEEFDQFFLNQEMENITIEYLLPRWGDYYDESILRATFRRLATCNVRISYRNVPGFYPSLFAAINPNVDPVSVAYYAEYSGFCQDPTCDVFWEYNPIASGDTLASLGANKAVLNTISNHADRYLRLAMKDRVDSLIESGSFSLDARQTADDAVRQALAESLSSSGVPIARMFGEYLMDNKKLENVATIFQNSYATNLYKNFNRGVKKDTFVFQLMVRDLFNLFAGDFQRMDDSVVEQFARTIAVVQNIGSSLGAGPFHHPLHRIF